MHVLNESGVVPRVVVSTTQVETPLLTSAAGSVLTLLNWNESPVETLAVTVLLEHDVESVTAIGANISLKFTSTQKGGQFRVAFSMTLEHCDFVALRAKK